LTPSAALAAVVGAAPLPRTEVVSKLWVYIKKHSLQDKVNKRNINADDKLKAIFGKAQVTMFELAGLIGKHLK
jgi:chromatin remodeling complex protein RSC6